MGVRQTLLALLLVAAVVAGGHAAAGAEAAIVRAAADVVGNVEAVRTLCCTNKTGYDECVEVCFDYYPREQAEKICDPGCQDAYLCRAVSGDKCPSGYRSSGLLLADSMFLYIVVGEVQDGTTLCCSNMTGFHECVEDCFAYFPREQADKICDPGCQEAYECQTVSGDKCPSGHRSTDDLASSEKGNALFDTCMSGCKSSVCSKMINGAGSRRLAVKRALESCNISCYNFCIKGGVRVGTSTA